MSSNENKPLSRWATRRLLLKKDEDYVMKEKIRQKAANEKKQRAKKEAFENKREKKAKTKEEKLAMRKYIEDAEAKGEDHASAKAKYQDMLWMIEKFENLVVNVNEDSADNTEQTKIPHFFESGEI